MGTKIRKQIYIEPEQDALLKQISEETGISEAEIIRQAIDAQVRELYDATRKQQAWGSIRAFITERMKQGPTPGGRTWKREDLYDR